MLFPSSNTCDWMWIRGYLATPWHGLVIGRDLGMAVFGEKWGIWAVAPFQWSVLVGLAITYTATAGQSLQVRPNPRGTLKRLATVMYVHAAFCSRGGLHPQTRTCSCPHASS
jgi:hypothetical protein